MSTSPLLGIELMVEAQANPYIVFNEAVLALESAAVEGVGSDAGAPSLREIVTDATTNHDILSSELEVYLRMTNSGASTVTVPENATEAIETGFSIHIRAAGEGGVTVTPESSNVTINGLSMDLAQYRTATLIKVATDEWDLIPGDVEEAS